MFGFVTHFVIILYAMLFVILKRFWSFKLNFFFLISWVEFWGRGEEGKVLPLILEGIAVITLELICKNSFRRFVLSTHSLCGH